MHLSDECTEVVTCPRNRCRKFQGLVSNDLGACNKTPHERAAPFLCLRDKTKQRMNLIRVEQGKFFVVARAVFHGSIGESSKRPHILCDVRALA